MATPPSPALTSPPESALPLAEMFTPLLLESSNGFAVLDAAGRYAYVSASMCNLLSLDKAALLGCVGHAAPRRAGCTFSLLRCALVRGRLSLYVARPRRV